MAARAAAVLGVTMQVDLEVSRMLTVSLTRVVEVLAAAATCGTAWRRRPSAGERRQLERDDELQENSMHEGSEVTGMVCARGIEQWLTEVAGIEDRCRRPELEKMTPISLLDSPIHVVLEES
uniref:OSJNBa0022F16.11 protein n=1 Tax=Oryza sativa subsp. japonica TaxID=39947 RepID=Q7XKZ3_ORYSJ|nr:OSJNBa0022F16.11 [Oryza sativa Japonica Group]